MRKIGNSDFSTKPTNYYNLDVIISVGYRVKSIRGTQFRRWATERLKEYMIKGFTMDDERLKGNGGGNYWKELLDRIRDIRSSEKVLYRQVLDLYATSVDYNPHSDESIRFFKIVQNKLHFAAHGHTAAEVIYERADAEKPFMGLTSFSGELPALKDISIAKNYLSEDELKILNNLVSGYFDLAEINAIENKPMYMNDYVGVSVVILSIIGVIHIDGRNQISMLWLWLFSAFINSVMQEVLVRGYLYQMIKNNYNTVAAVIVSTGLFTFAHGGAFEAGILPVLNVITMSLFVTAVLEYTESLIAPIVIHFLWNGVGTIILGGVSLAEDYPHMFNMVISGNSILSGDNCKIEGSIVVLLVNLILMFGFVMAKKKRDKNL